MRKVLFVCLGNIARSPLAKVIFQDLIHQKGLETEIEVDSAGTAGYHIGKAADHRSIETAEANGLTLNHIARKFTASDLDDFDHIAVMDEKNFEFVHELYHKIKKSPPSVEKLFLIRDFDPTVTGIQEVSDPFYGGKKEFEVVFETLTRSNTAFMDHLIKEYSIVAPEKEEEAEEE